MKTKFLMMLSVVALFVAGSFVSCEVVDPSDPNAIDTRSPRFVTTPMNGGTVAIDITGSQGATAKTIRVNTTASDWDFDVVQDEDWLQIMRVGNVLSLRAEANNGATDVARTATVTITAEGFDEPSVVTVTQDGTIEEVDARGRLTARLKDKTATTTNVFIEGFSEQKDVTVNMYLIGEFPTDATSSFGVAYDDSYLASFNLANPNEPAGALFPKGLVDMTNFTNLTLAAGTTTSDDITITIDYQGSQLRPGVRYLLPLVVNNPSDNLKVGSGSESRVNYVITKQPEKGAMKNIAFPEVNRTNILNFKELKLNNGENFFDAVVMFSSNFEWNGGSQTVVLSHNPNNQQLLDEYQTYIRPLQAEGIKVYLSLLPAGGNPAAVGNLTEKAAKLFAVEVAEEVARYSLDGTGWDNEYAANSQQGSAVGDMLTNGGTAAQFDRLFYETKKAMTEIAGPSRDDQYVFQFNMQPGYATIEGVKGEEYVDFVIANYGGSGIAYANSTVAQLSGFSIEMHLSPSNATTAESTARQQAQAGYGWGMYFAIDPVPGAYLALGSRDNPDGPNANFEDDWKVLAGAAAGMYPGFHLVKQTHYYKKDIDRTTGGIGLNGGDTTGFNPERFEMTAAELDKMVELADGAAWDND